MSGPVRNAEGWIDLKRTLDQMDQEFEEQPLPDLDAEKPRFSPAQRELCEKAIRDPSSLTRAEKNWVTGRPPPEQEDALLQSRLGTTKDALFKKALDAPEELSARECEILIHGADYDGDIMSAAQKFQRAFEIHSEDAKLKRSAHDAVTMPDELRACVAASRRDSAAFRPIRETKRAKKSEENRQEIQAARAKRQEMIDRGQAEAQKRWQEAREVVEQRVRGQEESRTTN